MTAIRVHLDEPEHASPRPVGTARIDRRRGVDSTEFSYDHSFLAASGWPIGPDLPLDAPRTVVAGLPGALADSAPDLWGRNLITRRLAAQAREAGHVAPTPTEVDFLLGASDLTRQGALRLCLDDRLPYLAEHTELPQLVDLGTLLEASLQVAGAGDATSAVATLLDAGSGSLGGARPKASVADGDRLLIAKFRHPDDPWDVMRWEAVALTLAARCGIRTPGHQLVEVGREPVLLLDRFDRSGSSRIPYLSAKSMLGSREGAAPDYLELVDALATHGSDVAADLVELWRRIAFSVVINNVDDHMRNHAFLRARGGWQLSPVFDVNPDRRQDVQRVTSLAGATTALDCHATLFASAASFGISLDEAQRAWSGVLEATAGWREVATAHGIPTEEQEQFAPALDRFRTP